MEFCIPVALLVCANAAEPILVSGPRMSRIPIFVFFVSFVVEKIETTKYTKDTKKTGIIYSEKGTPNGSP